MIILVHNMVKVTSILNEKKQPVKNFLIGQPIGETLEDIAKVISNGLVIWCHEKLLTHMNIEKLSTIFHHKRILASYNPTDFNFLPKQIEYIEQSYYMKINKNVTYPTWLMSPFIGGINTAVLTNLKRYLNYNLDFNYFLLSLAKRGMPEGLFCYSEPNLLKTVTKISLKTPQVSKQVLFKFVKQHYKWVWVFFLSWCYAIYERKISVYSVINSLFYKKLKMNFNLEEIKIQSFKKIVQNKTVDVIIPTIGRKQYLYDVLKDLERQTYLPKNVIIVEQNPKPNSVSELEYLKNENWPFNIKHKFTNQPGVCNARNIALSQIESEWSFFADDDIRFDANFIETSFKKVEEYGITVLNYLCLQPKQKQTYFKTCQTIVFGCGSSMVKSSGLSNLKFDMAYEFGFGEDADFGMQLRNKGEDVIFIPNIKITHLKAPMGGYRTKIKQLWDDETIQPKPSPTVQLLYQTHYTKEQLNGYKLVLFLRQLKASGYKKPIRFKSQFKKQWNQSVFWSKKLKQQA